MYNILMEKILLLLLVLTWTEFMPSANVLLHEVSVWKHRQCFVWEHCVNTQCRSTNSTPYENNVSTLHFRALAVLPMGVLCQHSLVRCQHPHESTVAVFRLSIIRRTFSNSTSPGRLTWQQYLWASLLVWLLRMQKKLVWCLITGSGTLTGIL